MKNINENMFNFGISRLHAWNSYFMYNLSFKKWQVRDPDLKKQRDEMKKRIQQEFRKNVDLLIDVVWQGSGLTNDESTARKYYSEIETTAKITGLNESLVEIFAVILQAISCGEMIDAKLFGQYAMETAKMFVQDYGW